jgi:uncharacterized membrane protein YdbT with pleckstrin-like domain
MGTQTFKPSPRYRGKLYLVTTVIAVVIMLAGLPLYWLAGRDDGLLAAIVVIGIFLLVDLAWYLPTLLLINSYFRSLVYEIQDDEVIVHVGIWTKSVKHVPFRTVTNLKVNRDIFDRWFFDLGSLNIQTAGMSGSQGAEEALVGLPNVDEIYELVVEQLRRFRSGMTPTATEVEQGDAGTLNAMLSELVAIRKGMEE